jgi:hypothetical protein
MLTMLLFYNGWPYFFLDKLTIDALLQDPVSAAGNDIAGVVEFVGGVAGLGFGKLATGAAKEGVEALWDTATVKGDGSLSWRDFADRDSGGNGSGDIPNTNVIDSLPNTNVTDGINVGTKFPEGSHALIGADKAIINPTKLTEYALNPDHPVGKNKARVFESALGFNRGNADELMAQLQHGVKNNTPIAGKVDQYGERFTVEIPVKGPKGNGVVTSGWIYKPGSEVPELTTILVKK